MYSILDTGPHLTEEKTEVRQANSEEIAGWIVKVYVLRFIGFYPFTYSKTLIKEFFKAKNPVDYFDPRPPKMKKLLERVRPCHHCVCITPHPPHREKRRFNDLLYLQKDRLEYDIRNIQGWD